MTQNFPNPIRSRWGDYGAASVDGNSIWIASEYIAHACDYVTWGVGPRAAQALVTGARARAHSAETSG